MLLICGRAQALWLAHFPTVRSICPCPRCCRLRGDCGGAGGSGRSGTRRAPAAHGAPQPFRAACSHGASPAGPQHRTPGAQLQGGLGGVSSSGRLDSALENGGQGLAQAGEEHGPPAGPRCVA